MKKLSLLAIVILVGVGIYFVGLSEQATSPQSDAQVEMQVEIGSTARASSLGGGKSAKCSRCFLQPASAAKGIEAWCDGQCSTAAWRSFINNSCDSECANQKCYNQCLRR
jgi:hypothetical protein